MLFQSEKIYLRKMTGEDVDVYHTWRNDVEVMRTTSPSMDVYTWDDTSGFVNQVILQASSSKSYMIVDSHTNRPIGITSLIQIDLKNRNAECIIDIGEKEFWGKGYAREALKLLLDYAFLEMNLHRVSLRVFSFNEKAIKLYDKLGFKQEGISRQFLFREGKWHDLVHMGILQQEYIS
ncbi:GNAT family N-acetyltransferase [Brevibacillus porteri]|uniref:GNAT family N-acetyltransferase n=1 Tax=Brevibacillus porteri TaxID=2126350 RepID=A0ABX5FVH3_9BACL|nr:GNAT family protein [Brevibacillus porteri]MED1797459.1 GNAT family protein [Brevibacillus porteri]MED2129529.1 GNAT family protein [Brevibacillus porteri]MED2743630.1 GNAT family protein [Brevibacillus porteri]MED2815188.1 GNAT family protein [Brevibacillus porteri]MED2897187.1 GNAT family protein [Brevibacillus porteri]